MYDAIGFTETCK